MAFPCYQEGETFSVNKFKIEAKHTFSSLVECIGDRITTRKRGFAVDNNYNDIVYLPEDAQIHLANQEVVWTANNKKQDLATVERENLYFPNGL